MERHLIEQDRFYPQAFIDEQVNRIREALGAENAIIACSGGVDSTTCAALTRRAIGENLICVFIDTNFMRLGEPDRVVKTLRMPPLSLPVKLVQAREKFMNALEGLEDAEAKRKAFRSTFYSILSEVAMEEGSRYLVQGTILPDVIETVKGIKTQHNVLEQLEIDTKETYGFKVVEPLVSLYKPQVREVARRLGLPLATSERQPFPGPGLSVRVVGEITPEKLEVEKKATEIVEGGLEGLGAKQYFPATLDSQRSRYPQAAELEEVIRNLLGRRGIDVRVQLLKIKATGIRDGARLYGKIVTVDVRDKEETCLDFPVQTLDDIQNRVVEMDNNVSRVLYRLTEEEKTGKWIVAIRAVETFDFITASIFNVPWRILTKIGKEILNSSENVAATYYDITPKPPASIEFE